MVSNDLLQKNYSNHLSFKFRDKDFKIDVALVNNFNRTYYLLKNRNESIGSKNVKDFENNCLIFLGEIFVLLKSQTEFLLDELFFTELETNIIELLQNEFAFFKRNIENSYSKNLNQKTHELVTSYNSENYLLGSLNKESVAEINNLCKSHVELFRQNSAKGLTKREDLSVGSGKIIKQTCDILNRNFLKSGILDAVSIANGCKMSVSGCGLELSIPKASWWKNNLSELNRPPNTLYAHFDESIAHPKAIVYLSDVGENNGPTSFYPGVYEELNLNYLQKLVGRIVGKCGANSQSALHDHYKKSYHQSMSSENFRKHFMLIPEKLRFNSHFGWDILPDSQLEQELVSREIKVLGPAGSFIVFDGSRLLHRGGLIEEGERLVLQVIFSKLPSFENRLKNKIKKYIK